LPLNAAANDGRGFIREMRDLQQIARETSGKLAALIPQHRLGPLKRESLHDLTEHIN